MIAIDLGSNTIRFIEFDGFVWGNNFEKIVKTAESLYVDKKIGDAALIRIIGAIEEAKKIFDFSSHEIVAYATAAMRIASNRVEIIQSLKVATGVVFTVIDAEKEAFLTLTAVLYRLKIIKSTPRKFILADIGGGSTELIQYDNGKYFSSSINMGIVTLSESIITPTLLKEKIDSFKVAIQSILKKDSETTLVLTAGTPTTISAYLLGMDYITYDSNRINGFKLRLEDCYRVYHELLAMDESTRIRYVGIGREDLIITGILMVTSIYQILEINEAIIVDDGLREGIALEYYQ